MKPVVKIGLAFLIVIFVVVLFAWLYLDYPLPQYEGELTLEGLQNPVEVYFDDYAVPHIYAENEHDLFLVAGFIAARERLFQMTSTAAAAEGRLAELFGKTALADDIYLRTWGIPQVARKLADNMHPEAREITSNFCDGINAYIDAAGPNLPIEFKLLGIRPIRWTPAHATGYQRLMAHNLTFSWKAEVVLGQVAYMLGEERLRELWPFYPEDLSFLVPGSRELYGHLWGALFDRDESLKGIQQMAGGHIGSNNWVLSGSRTTTGKPILANDPHLPFSQPARWYEMHLVGGRFNVSGMCLAGIPVPVLGHNGACAWGFTNLMVDDVDFFVETVNGENRDQYFHDGEWRDMNVREEIVAVKGEEDTTIVLRETHHGPVISDIHPILREGDLVVSMRWGGHDLSDEIYSILKLNIMENWDDFSDAAKAFGVPGQNVVYADTAGNIGWRPFSRIPVRKGGRNLVPVPGDSSEWDWKGYVPFEEMPAVLNPPSGFIATANHKVFDDAFPYYVSSFWEDPSRAQRIWEVLGQKTGISIREVKETQRDVISPFARDMAKFFVAAADNDSKEVNGNLVRAVEFLRGWNGDHSVDSPEAPLFNAALLRLLENVYADEMNLMGEKFYEGWLALPSMSLKNLRYALQNGWSSWFDNVETKDELESRDDILRLSLEQGVHDLERLLGPDPSSWRWGRVHKLTHKHAIGSKSRLLDALVGFNVGPFETGGANTTINNGEFLLNDPYDQVNGPSFRRIVDLANLSETLLIIPTGQSGLPKSPHYDDQAALYHSGKYRRTYFREETVKNSGFRLLTFSPSG